ncbi:hypothetical protein J2S66_005620 [Saccharothrix longispora]|uniref:NYN domain-containing protein n=1 Tax=Saccharothrix longispora TaxID=33920 RepID=A0ABU1Q2X3_9PSEU|nr:hypothetical protein [Saccharothrix longispora]
MSYLKPGITGTVVAVDVFNVMHRGWPEGEPLSIDHLEVALGSLGEWLERRGITPCDLRLVSDPHWRKRLQPDDISKFESWIRFGKIRVAPPSQKADPIVLGIAKDCGGIVVSDDRYTEWYCHGHEWLLFQSGRSVVPSKDPLKPWWVWKWTDYRRKRWLYYGRPDPDFGRVMNLAHLREIEEVTGFNFQDSQWPSDGGPVGFHHMARGLAVKTVHKVRERANALGIPDGLSTFLTDAQVRRIWNDFDPRGRRSTPWRNAA